MYSDGSRELISDEMRNLMYKSQTAQMGVQGSSLAGGARKQSQATKQKQMNRLFKLGQAEDALMMEREKEAEAKKQALEKAAATRLRKRNAAILRRNKKQREADKFVYNKEEAERAKRDFDEILAKNPLPVPVIENKVIVDKAKQRADKILRNKSRFGKACNTFFGKHPNLNIGKYVHMADASNQTIDLNTLEQKVDNAIQDAMVAEEVANLTGDPKDIKKAAMAEEVANIVREEANNIIEENALENEVPQIGSALSGGCYMGSALRQLQKRRGGVLLGAGRHMRRGGVLLGAGRSGGVLLGAGTSGGRMYTPSPWVEHVKNFAKQNGISYKEALKLAGPSYRRMQ